MLIGTRLTTCAERVAVTTISPLFSATDVWAWSAASAARWAKAGAEHSVREDVQNNKIRFIDFTPMFAVTAFLLTCFLQARYFRFFQDVRAPPASYRADLSAKFAR
jgi:hypothetical protein